MSLLSGIRFIPRNKDSSLASNDDVDNQTDFRSSKKKKRKAKKKSSKEIENVKRVIDDSSSDSELSNFDCGCVLIC